jgi:hypothetical protein
VNELPPPLTEEERAADRRALKVLVLWLGGCAAIAAVFLVVAIYLDWF